VSSCLDQFSGFNLLVSSRCSRARLALAGLARDFSAEESSLLKTSHPRVVFPEPQLQVPPARTFGSLPGQALRKRPVTHRLMTGGDPRRFDRPRSRDFVSLCGEAAPAACIQQFRGGYGDLSRPLIEVRIVGLAFVFIAALIMGKGEERRVAMRIDSLPRLLQEWRH
jgi:hypothetical protein